MTKLYILGWWNCYKETVYCWMIVVAFVAFVTVIISPRWMFPCEGGDNINTGDRVVVDGITGSVTKVIWGINFSRCQYDVLYKNDFNEFKTVKVRYHNFDIIDK